MTASLVVCAHGTRDPLGRETVRDVVAAVAERLPGVSVREAYVDVHGPEVAEVVAGLTTGERVAGVVVPLLLAGGYHVRVDIAHAVAGRTDVVVARALGPDDRLVELLVERLRAAGAEPGSTVVLVPAGSSDPRAQSDSADMAQRLARRWGGAVTLGYAAGPTPTVADAVRSARASAGGPVAVASYLLAPGFFQLRVEQAGGDLVTAPLAPDHRIIDVVVDRYRAALAFARGSAGPVA